MLSSRSPDLSASARRAAVAVTLGAGEGAELALLTALLERGGRKLGRRGWGRERARARGIQLRVGGLGSRDGQTPPLQADSRGDVTIP